MRRIIFNMTIVLASFCMLIFAAGSDVFAQTKVALTIQTNVSNAQVYINDNLAGYASPTLSILLFPGVYTVRVAKDGYQEYRTTINVVSAPISIYATLGHSTPSNPPSPSMPPSPPTPPPPPPIPAPGYQLYIDSNIDGARVYIDNVYVGRTPYQGTWHRGGYVIRITAPGYNDYVDSIYLYRSMTINAHLSPLPVPYEIRLPDELELESKSRRQVSQ